MNEDYDTHLRNDYDDDHKGKYTGPSFYERLFPGPYVAGYDPIPQDDDDDDDIKYKKTGIKSKRDEHLYDNGLPNFLDIYASHNVGIAVSYMNTGIAGLFLQTPVSYYLIHTQNATSAQMGALQGLCALPWSLKFIYGMISDGNAINGYRRKPWLFFGWVFFILSNLWLASMGSPSIPITILLCFAATVFLLMAEVSNDTLCVERAKLEANEQRGVLQTTVFTLRAFGAVVGAVLGAILYNKPEWGWGLSISDIFLMQALFPVCGILLFIWPLVELTQGHAPPLLYAQIHSLWTTLKLRAVWKPMIFVYLYSVFQIPNMAMKNFLVKGLEFTDFDLGLIGIASATFGWLGLIIYKEFFFNTSWRRIYIGTTLIGLVFSLLQLVLILRYNIDLGIPDIVFAVGDDAVAVLVDKVC